MGRIYDIGHGLFRDGIIWEYIYIWLNLSMRDMDSEIGVKVTQGQITKNVIYGHEKPILVLFDSA